MKIINFKKFSQYHNFALDIQYALDYCKKNKINKLVIDKDRYDIDSDYCTQRDLAISNHGFNGRKRIAVLLEDMNDFTIDFSGSILSLHSIVIPVAIRNCQNVVVTNLSIENSALDILYTKVIACEKDSILVENINESPFKLINNRLYTWCDGRVVAPIDLNIEFNGDTKEIEKGTADNTLGTHVRDLEYQLLENNRMRIFGFTRTPPVNNILAFCGGHRYCSGIFCENSTNIKLESVDIFSTIGMGVIAQCCNNVTLDCLRVLRKDPALCSAGADATHFVACTGRIAIENCLFEAMLDDAVNIHGIYTKIISKRNNEIFVKEMHGEATGIRIYKIGDKVNVVNRKSLISYTEKTITDVEYLNDCLIKLTFHEGTEDIVLGDLLENVSHIADFVFRNNIVRNNRARGMLIANRGKSLVENNYFHTSGTAIKFESDGESWFESGPVDNVVIRNNMFDRCKHGGWGEYVVECQERAAIEPDHYFHNRIEITENKFKLIDEKAIKMDNINEFYCSDNEFIFDENIKPEIVVTNVRNWK